MLSRTTGAENMELSCTERVSEWGGETAAAAALNFCVANPPRRRRRRRILWIAVPIITNAMAPRSIPRAPMAPQLIFPLISSGPTGGASPGGEESLNDSKDAPVSLLGMATVAHSAHSPPRLASKNALS